MRVVMLVVWSYRKPLEHLVLIVCKQWRIFDFIGSGISVVSNSVSIFSREIWCMDVFMWTSSRRRIFRSIASDPDLRW